MCAGSEFTRESSLCRWKTRENRGEVIERDSVYHADMKSFVLGCSLRYVKESLSTQGKDIAGLGKTHHCRNRGSSLILFK